MKHKTFNDFKGERGNPTKTVDKEAKSEDQCTESIRGKFCGDLCNAVIPWSGPSSGQARIRLWKNPALKKKIYQSLTFLIVKKVII
jgi:hypothetical protein